MDTVLLGFDVRPLRAPRWDDERRAHFLHRRDVDRVLSVDPACGEPLLAGLWDRECGRPRPAEPFLPELERTLALPGCPPRGRRVVLAAGVVRDSADTTARRNALDGSLGFWRAGLDAEPDYRAWPDGRLCTPDRPADAWILAGYDVADGALTSALSNMGVGPGRQSALAGVLNRWHLFEHLGDALTFRDQAERDILEHAPMLVYALWWVEPPPAAVGQPAGGH